MNDIRRFVIHEIETIPPQLRILRHEKFARALFPERDENPGWFRVIDRFEQFALRFDTARKKLGTDEKCDSHKELVLLSYMLEEVGMMFQKVIALHYKACLVSDWTSAPLLYTLSRVLFIPDPFPPAETNPSTYTNQKSSKITRTDLDAVVVPPSRST